MGKTLFVTGKLASKGLKKILKTACIEGDEFVLPIDVAALATTKFIARHLSFTPEYDLIMIPGLCAGDPGIIEEKFSVKTIKGPSDLLDIPGFFDRKSDVSLNEHDIKIFAEINNAPLLTIDEIRKRATYYKACGADVIDIGCIPGMEFHSLSEVVSSLKEEGYGVSIDTFDVREIAEADEAGIDYVLSLQSNNMQVASEIESIPVVIPDLDKSIESLHSNISFLEEMGKEYIIDPILSPLNFGFIDSLERYMETRRRYPDAEMLAGLGNVIELCDADSVGMNLLLCGMMEELSIQNLLTTEASHRTRGAVRELDIARRMTYYAKKNSILIRHFTPDLLVVKEERASSYTEEGLKEIAESLHPRDEDFRIFVADKIYVFNGTLFVSGCEKGEIFSKLAIKDADHAFYMGNELERAELALKLGKRYIQEQPLGWGYLGEGGD